MTHIIVGHVRLTETWMAVTADLFYNQLRQMVSVHSTWKSQRVVNPRCDCFSVIDSTAIINNIIATNIIAVLTIIFSLTRQ